MELEALPKGFRFRPTDKELINHYLRLKINGSHSAVKVIPEIDVCKWEPWDLPELSVIKSDDPEWFFFCPRDRKYPNGRRSNRATEAGYWKATGKDRTIKDHKASPSGGSNACLIGMKKTLVFYQGRAPKGERTSWIMHEYRATEPDLDGTSPGQGDYVLCRLFHKVDGRLDNSKYDELEPTGSSPSTSKSSPGDMSSEPVALDTQILNAPEDVKKWSTNETDHRTTTTLVPVESCESDEFYHLGEEMVMEGYAPPKEVPVPEGPTNNELDDNALHTPQLWDYTDLGACVGSPFSDDFGNDHNGSHFQDGTSEQDVSFASIWEDLENKNNLNDESTGQTNPVVTNDNFMHKLVGGIEKASYATFNVNNYNARGKTNTEMVQLQGQAAPSFFQAAPSADRPFAHYAVKEDASPFNVDDTSSHFHGHNDAFYSTFPGELSSTPSGGTGIKIRSRQPQNQSSSVNAATQGTTSRRIRLITNSLEEQESQSADTEATIDTDTSYNSEEPGSTKLGEDDVEDTASSSDSNLESRVKRDGENSCGKIALFMSSTALSARRGARYLKLYAVGMYLVIIMSVVLLGMWKCPSLHAMHG